MGFLRWDMASNLQVELGFRPGFGQQPDAAPEAALQQQAPEPVDAVVADHADGARRTATGVTVIGSQRFGWTFRISSGVSQGIDKSVVQSDWEFLRIGVDGRR